ncbi:MAG: site-2 protease family protein [Gammaproteobacteria bacterium]
MPNLNTVQLIAVWALPVLFAITVHEVSHGWVARWFGDPTAMMLGRLTLNPIKHIDPFGTILVPLASLLFFGFVFGWAKPVPVTWENLRNPKRDMAIVALAGPLSNLAMAIIWALVIKIAFVLPASVSGIAYFLFYSAVAGIFVNGILMILNLVPIPPLDGGRVLVGLLPGPLAWQISRVEPYGLIIVVLMLMTPIWGYILWPPLSAFVVTMSHIAGIDANAYLGVLQHLLHR